MIAELNSGCRTIEITKDYEIYQLGDKYYKFYFNTWSITELKGEAFVVRCQLAKKSVVDEKEDKRIKSLEEAIKAKKYIIKLKSEVKL